MKRIFLLLTVTFLLFACNSVYKENIEAAEGAMGSGDFESALEYYTTALEEEPDDSDVKAKVELLTDYEFLLDTIEESDWTGASELANKILKNDAITPDLKEIVNGLLVTIEDEQTNDKKVARELKKIEELIDDDNIDAAREKLEALDADLESSQVDDMQKKLSKAEKRVAKYEAEKQDAIDTEKQLAQEAEEKAKQEAERKAAKKDEVNKEKPIKTSGLQGEYMDKANELDSKRNKDDPEYGYPIQGEEWHNLLNDVWAKLKDTMPKSEFDTLKVEQKEWIDEKEKYEEEAWDAIIENEAGMRPHGYLTQQDAERTFYLIENHMK